MKKIIIILTVIFGVLSLVSCGSGGSAGGNAGGNGNGNIDSGNNNSSTSNVPTTPGYEVNTNADNKHLSYIEFQDEGVVILRIPFHKDYETLEDMKIYFPTINNPNPEQYEKSWNLENIDWDQNIIVISTITIKK